MLEKLEEDSVIFYINNRHFLYSNFIEHLVSFSFLLTPKISMTVRFVRFDLIRKFIYIILTLMVYLFEPR